MQVGKKDPLDLPTGQWLRFKIVAALGEEAPATWALRVTVPGREPHLFRELPHARPEFEQLTWVGFMSNATVETAFYLDNFELRCREDKKGRGEP